MPGFDFEEAGGQIDSQLPFELLLKIDWEIQAEGCKQMYEQTGDTDYLLMGIEAGANTRRKAEYLLSLSGPDQSFQPL